MNKTEVKEFMLSDGELIPLRPVRYYPMWKTLGEGAIFLTLLGVLLWGMLQVSAADYQHEQDLQLQQAAQQ